jgi:rRNA maturation protein Nop10
MKIELIKLKFNDTCAYKHKSFTYCCDEIHQNDCIIFTNEDLYPLKHIDDGNFIPQFCTSHTEVITSYEDEWEQTDNYPIQFCPHCGEQIEISVVDEIDVSDKYNELTKQREELWKKCQRTDSKKEDCELRKQVRKLDDQINDFYELGEWKGEY